MNMCAAQGLSNMSSSFPALKPAQTKLFLDFRGFFFIFSGLPRRIFQVFDFCGFKRSRAHNSG